MPTSDIFQNLADLPSEAVQSIIDRLEFRGKDPDFVRMRETYFSHLRLEQRNSVLDLGCGTGVVSRALAGNPAFSGQITGLDFSADLINAARAFAADEGHASQVTFEVADSHQIPEQYGQFDLILAHTLVSHVTDPLQTIAEMARMLAPGGTIAIFDGDYASLTFGAGDSAENGEIVAAILGSIVANPDVMRQLPKYLLECGLQLDVFLPEVLAEAGQGPFFIGLANAYVPMIIRSGMLDAGKANGWLARQIESREQGQFFGACNYYTYIADKPDQR